MECILDRCKHCEFLDECRFSPLNIERKTTKSCATCKHETKDICEEPCIDCSTGYDFDMWEAKDD